jgi:predicted amidohydrolase YtcJ
MARYVGSNTEVFDAAGRLVTPGFIEGHGHFMGLGDSKLILDLTQAHSFGEIAEMVGHVASDARPGAWIAGRGWHQEKWDELPADTVEGVPTHRALSALSPNNPVILVHASGHASFVNAKAMELAGIDGNTPDPAGGEIVHDRQGEPTGLLREKAQGLAQAARSRDEAGRDSAVVAAENRRRVELAGEDLLSKGITSFHDAGSSFATIDFYKELAAAGELPVRLYVMVRFETIEDMDRRLPEYRMTEAYDGFLTVRSIKRQIDGALGSHGAWLLEPYVDLPQSSGLALETVDELKAAAEVAFEHGFQVATHAIGDRANREVLNVYEEVFNEHGNPPDLRWRIEHAQHLHPDDVHRFADLGVIAAMQGVHATSDGPWIPRRLGDDRAESGAYVWRDLLDAGVIIGNGTDVPVEDADPIACFYSSVSRRLADGSVFYPEQRMTREEALRSYTMANAYASFEEDVKGSITPGKYADIVILSENIMTVPEEQIPNARVDVTILGGKVVYRRQ